MRPQCEKPDIGRYRRFHGWDYSRGASLFITIATEPRRALFGQVAGSGVALSPLGAIVAEALEAMPSLNPGIALFGHVVMPDHVHFRCHLASGMAAPIAALGNAIRRFKNYTTKAYKTLLAERSSAISTPGTRLGDGQTAFGRHTTQPHGDGQTAFGQRWSGGEEPPATPTPPLWQQGYHDLLCLSREAIEAVEHYIVNNPLKWWLMHCDKTLMRVCEPLDSPLLEATGKLWRGVGNIGLIAPPANGHRIIAMRISRRIPEALFPELVADCLKVARSGAIFASTFFSPGEHMLHKALVGIDAPMIKLQSGEIGWGYRPSGDEPELFARGNLLVLAPMDSPNSPSSRRELLEMNQMAATIANSCPDGKAIYAQPAASGGGVRYERVG